MEVIRANESLREGWNDFVARNPWSVAWQEWEWSEAVQRVHRADFIPLAACDGSEIRGILPLYHVHLGRRKSALMSVPYAVAGGLLADDPAIQGALLDQAIAIARDLGIGTITFKQYKRPIEQDLRLDQGYYNRELDLTLSEADLLAQFEIENRRRIEAAESMGLEFHLDDNDLGTFHDLLFEHHYRQGLPCVSPAWIQSLHGFGMYSIARMRRDGAVVAATMVKQFKNTISFPFTCLRRDDESDRTAAFALYWALIRHHRAEGKEIFHSGRIPASNRADPWRLGWGGKKHPYFYQYYPATASQTESKRKGGRKRQILTRGWRCLPRWAARRMGPVIVRMLP